MISKRLGALSAYRGAQEKENSDLLVATCILYYQERSWIGYFIVLIVFNKYTTNMLTPLASTVVHRPEEQWQMAGWDLPLQGIYSQF